MAFRQRGKTRKKGRLVPESDPEDDDDDISAQLKRAAQKAAPKAKPAPPATKLSFGDDDEKVVFKKKKKKPKGRGLSALSLNDSDAAELSTAYTGAALEDLKKGTPQMPSNFVKKQPAGDDGPAVMRISGSFRAGSSAQYASAMPDSFVAPSGTSAPPADPCAMPLPPPSGPKPPRAPAAEPGPGDPVANGASAPNNGSRPASAAGADQNREGIEDDDGIEIPDEDWIRQAKARRQQLRQAELAPGHAPSEVMGLKRLTDYKSAEDAIKAGSSDEAGSDLELEEDMRIKFSVSGGQGRKGKSTAGTSAGQSSHIVSHEISANAAQASDGEDDDDADFASLQVKRALGTSAAQQSRLAAATARNAGQSAMAARRGALSPAQRASDALASVTEHVARQTERIARLTEELTRTRGQHTRSIAAVARNEQDFEEANVRYQFLQEIRVYVRDLCGCLGHVVADVEALEEERAMAMKEYFEEVSVQQDEVMAELMKPARAAVAAVGRGEDPEAAALAAEEAALDAALPELKDEFGRDENAARRDRARKRAGARAAALAAHAASCESAIDLVDRSDALLAAAQAAPDTERSRDFYARRVAPLLETARDTFKHADAAPQFSSLPPVLERLRDFKTRYRDQYKRAYVSEALPALLSVFVRLQLVEWDPLLCGGARRGEASPSVLAFEEQAWFTELFEFAETGDNDPDADLIPDVVAQVVVKILFAPMLSHAWDPGNMEQSAAVKSTVVALLDFRKPSAKDHFYALIESVKGQLSKAVAGLTLPPWPPSVLRANARIAATSEAVWQRALAVLRSVGLFEGLLKRELIADLAGQQILVAKINPCVSVAVSEAGRGNAFAVHVAMARATAAVAALPSAWRDGSITVAGCDELRKLSQRALVFVSSSASSRTRSLADKLRAFVGK